jgi:hypothetical protein
MKADDCKTCRHNVPETAGCAKREIGEDGYYHFPADGCHEAQLEAEAATLPRNREPSP